ncbi:glutamate synthase-related protein, partial [Staphylococcus saprophyticus]|uniref:glutamate synthase-related protein n=1 Tax=Staphylococcus saprophyticus TaxID=29385 RepID=UPI0037040307
MSQQPHQTLPQPINQIPPKTNTPQPPQNPHPFILHQQPPNPSTPIKQLPSARFPVTTHYFQHPKQIQIKLPQPTKPPQHPQLPPTKLYPSIPQVTPSTPPIPFISPPPHHHIYSIQDLPHLIHHLKNPNKHPNITLKLVSKTGVG